MAEQKISELPTATPLDGTEKVPMKPKLSLHH